MTKGTASRGHLWFPSGGPAPGAPQALSIQCFFLQPELRSPEPTQIQPCLQLPAPKSQINISGLRQRCPVFPVVLPKPGRSAGKGGKEKGQMYILEAVIPRTCQWKSLFCFSPEKSLNSKHLLINTSLSLLLRFPRSEC